MKKILLCLLLPVLFFSARAQKQIHYTNPILAGFYPDPSICQAGDDSKAYFQFTGMPGLVK